MAVIYSVVTGGVVALAAATAKSVLGLKAHANSGLLLSTVRVSFDGITASATPVLVELCACTWATNSPGTASTSVTPQQLSGPVMAAGFTAAKNWTTEPTVLSVLSEWLLTPTGGLLFEQVAYECGLSQGFALRLTAPATVNVRATLEASRI